MTSDPPRPLTSLGIDVGGLRKGYDLVLLDEARRPVETARAVRVESLGGLIEAWRPAVVAVDSPPMWAVDRPRATEAEMFRLGLNLYRTPWAEADRVRPFYAWMLCGFAAFAVAAAQGFAMYAGGASVQGRALEVFPYATSVILSGALKPGSLRKHAWRRGVLEAQGVETSRLRGPDQVDAALAALTGLMALRGEFCWRGNPDEGVIVMPCRPEALPLRFPRQRDAAL